MCIAASSHYTSLSAFPPLAGSSACLASHWGTADDAALLQLVDSRHSAAAHLPASRIFSCTQTWRSDHGNTQAGFVNPHQRHCAAAGLISADRDGAVMNKLTSGDGGRSRECRQHPCRSLKLGKKDCDWAQFCCKSNNSAHLC